MPSNREAYFEALKLDIPKSVIEFALKEVNGFSTLELTKNFDGEIKDYVFFKNAINRYINGEMIEYIFNKAYSPSRTRRDRWRSPWSGSRPRFGTAPCRRSHRH